MSDHADTIRRVLNEDRARYAHTFDSGPCQGPSLCSACRGEAAKAELATLVAERQQAIDERDALRVEVKAAKEWARVMEHERDYEQQVVSADLHARCEQAIDALRAAQNDIIAIHDAGWDSSRRNLVLAAVGRIRAALVSLGEQE